jgi:hypothetical protein
MTLISCHAGSASTSDWLLNWDSGVEGRGRAYRVGGRGALIDGAVTWLDNGLQAEGQELNISLKGSLGGRTFTIDHLEIIAKWHNYIAVECWMGSLEGLSVSIAFSKKPAINVITGSKRKENPLTM